MHETFQRDLRQLKLETARSYVKAVSTSMMPLATSQDSSLNVIAQVSSPNILYLLYAYAK